MTSHNAVLLALKHLWALVPSGGSLPENVWRGRLRFLVGLTWFHAAIIAAAGLLLSSRGDFTLDAVFRQGSILHALGEASIVAAFAALATWWKTSRTVQATAVGFGLMSASAILVHLSGGYIEFHFHFFVMLVFLALLQDWIPYLLAVAFVSLHHGVVGVLWPQEVYNHPAAINAPWTWAGIHAMFVLWSCVGSVIAWRFNERAFAQTALILEATGEGIFGLDREACIIFINPAAATLLHASARRAVGEPLDRVLRQLRDDGTLLAANESVILAPLRDGTLHYATEAVFGRPDGSSFPADYISTPMIERGQLTGVVVSFRDVTERKRVESDLQRSHRRLEEALAELKTTQRQVLQQERLRAMGQMASGIAHDFNNSLSPILGFSELLLGKGRLKDPEQVRSYLRLIHTAARDASAVVRRLRDLYRERGEAQAPAAVNLARCIEEAVALTQPRWKSQALAGGVTIHVELDVADIPLVACDGADVREALTNLIFNAVDAMPSGGTITLRARPDGDHVRLDVSDTGTGMTDAVRQRCMAPFFSTKGLRGTGMGLALVLAIVDRHRGTCAVESAPGEGTTVVIRLPIGARSAPALVDRVALDGPRRLRILVVEDEPLVRRVVTEQLADEGHTVESATNGLEGLEKLLAGWFDLIVTDRAMPEMNGDQLAVAIQRLAPGKPVIMLTGFGDLMAARGERPPGVRVIVSKPVTQDQLRQAVAHASESY